MNQHHHQAKVQCFWKSNAYELVLMRVKESKTTFKFLWYGVKMLVMVERFASKKEVSYSYSYSYTLVLLAIVHLCKTDHANQLDSRRKTQLLDTDVFICAPSLQLEDFCHNFVEPVCCRLGFGILRAIETLIRIATASSSIMQIQ